MKNRRRHKRRILKVKEWISISGIKATMMICEECNDRMIFALEDNDTSFMLGISTILECLKIAELEGAIPPITQDCWWEEAIRANSTR